MRWNKEIITVTLKMCIRDSRMRMKKLYIASSKNIQLIIIWVFFENISFKIFNSVIFFMYLYLDYVYAGRSLPLNTRLRFELLTCNWRFCFPCFQVKQFFNSSLDTAQYFTRHYCNTDMLFVENICSNQ